METLETKLERLLLNKPFALLSSEERNYVLNVLTEESYDAYHLILKHTHRAYEQFDEQNLLPRPEILPALKKTFEASFKSNTTIQIKRKVFASAACLAIAITLAVAFYKTNQGKRDVVVAEQATIQIHSSTTSTPTTTISLPEVQKQIVISQKPLKKVVAKPGRKIKAPIMRSKPSDTLVAETEKFYGLLVDPPLLGLDIDVNDQYLGIRIPANLN